MTPALLTSHTCVAPGQLETADADKVKAVVSVEEAIANKEAAKVKHIEEDCLADLSKAMPMLEEAVAALDTLKPSDITEVKGMKSPPAGTFRV